MTTATRRWFSTLLLLAVTALWGWTFVVIKASLAHYGVMGFLALRFALAALVLAPFALRRGTREAWAIGGGIGLLLVAAYLGQTYGLRYTSATNSGLITGLFVVFAPVCNRLLFRVRTRPLYWAAVGASVLGLALLTGGGVALFNLGDLLTLGCAVSFGFQIVLLDRHASRHDPVCLAAAQMASAAAVFLILWPLTEPLALPGPSVWWAIVITGVLCSAVGFFAQTLAQRDLPAVRVAVLLTMEPVFAVFFGWLLGGDRLSALQLAGGGLMVAALVVTNLMPSGGAASAGHAGASDHAADRAGAGRVAAVPRDES